MMNHITYDVRVYQTEKRKNAAGAITSYRVSWKVDKRLWKRRYTNAAQADAFRSELITLARRGEPFSTATGYPISWTREEADTTWFAFTLTYVDAKWPYASPHHRRGIAEALTDATEALLSEEGRHSREDLRRALRWAYGARIRDGGDPPGHLLAMVRWLEDNTIPLATLVERGTGATLIRGALDRISRTKDGKRAAANTANRKRMVLHNALEYAYETGKLPANPLATVKWAKPRTLTTVDPRVVINTEQARRFLSAVQQQGEVGPRLVAFFGCMYYAALRPEEAADLHRENLTSLPGNGDWGQMLLTGADPRPGRQWTNNGDSHERRELKHRADGDTRPVPIHPELVTLLRAHLDRFGTGRDGRVFVGPRGGLMTNRTYLEIFHEARTKGLTDEETASPLMDRPYALRHAAVSTWLNAGVPAPQVAQWAGHSVDVLLRVYAKCIHGQEIEAMRRVWDATRS